MTSLKPSSGRKRAKPRLGEERLYLVNKIGLVTVSAKYLGVGPSEQVMVSYMDDEIVITKISKGSK